MLAFRHFQPTDAEYEAIVAIYNRQWTDNPSTAAVWKHGDAKWNCKYLFQRFVAEMDGRIIAEGAYMEPYWSYQPGKIHYGYSIDPAYREMQHQGRSLHGAIYAYLLGELAERSPQKLCTGALEDMQARIHFFEWRGFEAKMRCPRSELRVDEFDASHFTTASEKAARAGIEILVLPELQARDGAWKEKLYDLLWELEQDVPSPDPPTREPMEEFEKTFAHPNFCADGWFIAVDGDKLVGISQLGFSSAQPDMMHTWLTGVVRSHRRRSVATALKVRAIEFARAQDVKRIVTDNEENNPMYQINLKLGFTPKPAWLDFEKVLNGGD